MAYLDLETPDGRRRVTIERERLRIGRLATNDVVLAFPQVSRQHAELRHINGQWWITDLGSTNGLQLDSRRIQDHTLRDGDQIVLAPGVSICFRDAHPAPLSAGTHAASDPLWQDSFPRRSPERHSYPLPVPAALPGVPTSPAGFDSPASGSGSAADLAAPFTYWSAPRAADRMPTVPLDPGESDLYAGVASRTSGRGSGGYPVPHGPLHSGAPVGSDDPFRREAPQGEAARATAGPATLLHVCQTCGQRTAPDAASCQHCHNALASECPNCRLSLLPIQDRCPRCHTPNTHSVRRVHARRPVL